MPMPKQKKPIWLKVVGFTALVYVGVYFGLSVNGRYEPSGWGLNGPKGYAWAPAGFVRELQWNQGVQILFVPLWEVDRFFWHNQNAYHVGKYPINKIPPSKHEDGIATPEANTTEQQPK